MGSLDVIWRAETCKASRVLKWPMSRAFSLSIGHSQGLYRAVAEQAEHVWAGIGGDGAIRFCGFSHVAFTRGEE
jgi:hypothetical protein